MHSESISAFQVFTRSKRRIFFWFLAGFLIGSGWLIYAFFTAPDIEVTLSLVDRGIEALAYVSCPVIAAGVTGYWVPLANSAIYGLIGLAWNNPSQIKLSHHAIPRCPGLGYSRILVCEFLKLLILAAMAVCVLLGRPSSFFLECCFCGSASSGFFLHPI